MLYEVVEKIEERISGLEERIKGLEKEVERLRCRPYYIPYTPPCPPCQPYITWQEGTVFYNG